MHPPAGDSRLWRRYALVLVDLQRDFWDDATAAAAPQLPDRVAGLSDQIAARRGGWDADLDRMDTLPT